MKLSENPFAILEASPRDPRHRLMEKADEAALVGGVAVDDALATLVHMNKRIAAELGWFPGASEEAVAAFRQYAEAAASGTPAAVPPVRDLGSALSQANALAAFFEVWPDSHPEYLIGLCRSLDMILSRITAAEMLSAVNADRQAGGWEIIPNEMALSEPLDNRLRELSQVVRSRIAKIRTDEEAAQVTKKLFMLPGFSVQGTVGQAVADAYLMRITDEETVLRDMLSQQLTALQKNKVTQKNLESLKEGMEKWNRLTFPLRIQTGTMRRTAHTLCHDMRECIVKCFNTAESVNATKSDTFPVFNGTRTVTVTYQSKKGSALAMIAMSKWLADLFPEQSDLVTLLKQDQDTLSTLIVNEDASVREALIKGKHKS